MEVTHITSNPRSGKQGTLNKDDNDHDDKDVDHKMKLTDPRWMPLLY